MRISFYNYIIYLCLLPAILTGQSVVNTVHNLSVSGTGTVRASEESEVCIFCHTPHNSSPRKPLWNRQDPGLTYTLYHSSTIQAEPGQPDGSSILCLSCHDGTIALGNVLNRTNPIDLNTGITHMPARANLSKDLSDDHPISFIYSSTLSATDGELADPATLMGPVHLENNKMQCTSCHDAHKDIYPYFLVASRQYSDLCQYCHKKTNWELSSHNYSNATWNGSGNDPWFHTPFNTVAENGCENCHNPHNAGGPARLTNYYAEENNCLDCHRGSVASKNILADLGKPYRHDVYLYSQVHDPQESPLVQERHVECVDCHNPHLTRPDAAIPPAAGGFILGVPGVNSEGTAISAIRYEFELCYRCHADSPDKPGSSTSREIEQDNTRFEFDVSGPSFHPIEGQGRNNNVPSLISPLSESSLIYCSDCHASNDSQAGGPHGSIYPHILKYNYTTTDYTQESYQAYELCFQCHDYNQIVHDESNEFSSKVHKKHIVDEDTPCNICHDPHGISSGQGNTSNHSHLINFDLSVVSASTGAMGRLEFNDNGSYAGNCYLNCHEKNHNPRSYN